MTSLWVPEMYIRAEQVESASHGTLKWLFLEDQGPGIMQWLRGSNTIFWVQGKPGSGKSTVMKHLTVSAITKQALNHNRDLTRPWNITGIFFTERGGQMQRSWHGMLSAMLHNLLLEFPKLIPTVNSIGLVANDARHRWSVPLLEKALLACRSQEHTAFRMCYFIDALDEHSGDHQEMCQFLMNLARVSPGKDNVIKICVASRPLNALVDLFEQYEGFRTQDWTSDDIKRYVFNRFSKQPRMRTLLKRKEHRGAIMQLKQRITERANGVFLWVRLVIDELSKDLTDGASIASLEKHMDDLPDDIPLFYRRMLLKVDPKYCQGSYVIFQAVMTARRPPTVGEIGLILHANASLVSTILTLIGEKFGSDLWRC